MYVQRNIVARSHNHCCSGNTTKHSGCARTRARARARVCVCVCVCVCRAICRCQMYKSTECCTTMLLWPIYVADNNKTYAGLHVKCPILHSNKRMFACSWSSLMYNLAKTLCSFSVFVSVAVKHFTKSDEINQSRTNNN